MKDKLVGVCESAFGFSVSVVNENTKVLNEDIEEVSDKERSLMGYTVEKVKIDSDNLDYFIEYSNNLERYMKDAGLDLHEAVERICENFDLLSDSIVIVVDESCVDKLDLTALKEHYNVKKM